jgi:hypothetical protein
MVEGGEMGISEETYKDLRLVSEEFRFEKLNAECTAFKASTTEAPMSALTKRVSAVEEQSLLVERGSEMVAQTVRSLCDQVSFLQSEIRRLSAVCESCLKQNRLDPSDIDDNLTSAAANRPLSSNQGRILNEKIATIAGYFEGGSAKSAKWADVAGTAAKLETARTIDVCLSGFASGSGATSFDGSSNVSIAIATQARRGLFEGELAYRRSCEYLDGTNGLDEETAKTLGLSFLKQSADLGHSDGQWRFGRCLEKGIGVEKDLVRAAEYYRLSAEQDNSSGQYHFGRCLENGIGIEKDMVRAAEYYRRSAEQEDFYGRFGPCSSIEIPRWVVVLDERSFSDRKSLNSVVFETGSRLEHIECNAFCESRLRSIVIPSSVVILGKSSFRELKSLECVTFERGSRLERIEESAFAGSGLKSVEIPSSVVVLGKSSFSACESLESVFFETGSRLEQIEELAFARSGLKSIEIPPRITFLDGSVFAGVSLTSLSIAPENRKFRVRESFLEDFEGSTIHRYFGSSRSIVLPSSVVVLGESSFRECNSIESVFLENGSRLRRIEESAFSGTGLGMIVIPCSVHDLGEWCLADCGWFDSVVGTASRIETALVRETPHCLFFLNDRYVVNPADYEEIRLIGRGATAEVFLCAHEGSGVHTALKKIHNLEEPSNQLGFIREIAMPLKLDLPGIVQFVGFRFPEPKTKDSPGAPGLIMTELMPNGALDDVLKSKHTGRPTPGFGPTEQSKAVLGIASTMAKIHGCSVIHRDLKPSHVLFDANWEIRIGDFGLSKVVAPGIKMTMSIGTPPFMGPELLEEDGTYSFPVDVYAFGILLYQFFTGDWIFEGMETPTRTPVALGMRVARGQRFKRPSGVPDAFWNLITRCWAQDPNDRPSFEEIVKLLLESNDFIFPGTDLEKYNEYRQRITAACRR